MRASVIVVGYGTLVGPCNAYVRLARLVLPRMRILGHAHAASGGGIVGGGIVGGGSVGGGSMEDGNARGGGRARGGIVGGGSTGDGSTGDGSMGVASHPESVPVPDKTARDVNANATNVTKPSRIILEKQQQKKKPRLLFKMTAKLIDVASKALILQRCNQTCCQNVDPISLDDLRDAPGSQLLALFQVGDRHTKCYDAEMLYEALKRRSVLPDVNIRVTREDMTRFTTRYNAAKRMRAPGKFAPPLLHMTGRAKRASPPRRLPPRPSPPRSPPRSPLVRIPPTPPTRRRATTPPTRRRSPGRSPRRSPGRAPTRPPRRSPPRRLGPPRRVPR